MAPQRILVLAGFAPSLINFRGLLLREMVARGHNVIAAAPGNDCTEGIRKQLASIGISFYSVPIARGRLDPFQDIQSYRALVRLFKELKPDLVLAYTAKAVIYGGIAAKKVGSIRFFPMITGLGYGFIGGEGFKRAVLRALLELLYRLGLSPAHIVIFQNPDDEALFRELNIIRSNKLSVCVKGSGVDLDAFSPKSLPDKHIFLMLSRLVADKGVREYVAAARRVKRYYSQVVFKLAGDLDPNPAAINYNELREWIEEGVIEYLGVVRQVQPVLATCRYYVLPSYREGTPRSVLEAMAIGRPIITTDAPGCRETVTHEYNGLLVPPRDIDALSAAMIRLIETPKVEIQGMAKASLDIVRDQFDAHKVNARILQVMDL
jgi:glycosyltransferase involved in cell wall biosynthesis